MIALLLLTLSLASSQQDTLAPAARATTVLGKRGT